MDLENRVYDHDRCPKSVGLTECPITHPYSYMQGYLCCKENIHVTKNETVHPHLNFDSEICQNNAGMDQSTPCETPPCVNYACRRYPCVLRNKNLSWSELVVLRFCITILIYLRDHCKDDS